MEDKTMSVDSAVSEVEYGIDRMKANTDRFDFYFKGSLACLKGILDYVLEEYNVKYSVGITDKENITVDYFESKARSCKNPSAASFIVFYRAEKAKLLADSKCKKLLEPHGSRDIAIHRKELPKNIGITLYESITSSFHIEIRDEKGNNTSTGDSPVRPATVNPPPKVQYFLQDWPNDDIPTLCEYTLNALKGFVATLRAKYP